MPSVNWIKSRADKIGHKIVNSDQSAIRKRRLTCALVKSVCGMTHALLLIVEIGASQLTGWIMP
jgi:hypothetical protein